MRILNVEVTSWIEWRRIKIAFGENGEALETFLAGMAVMSSGVKTSCDLGCWSI